MRARCLRCFVEEELKVRLRVGHEHAKDLFEARVVQVARVSSCWWQCSSANSSTRRAMVRQLSHGLAARALDVLAVVVIVVVAAAVPARCAAKDLRALVEVLLRVTEVLGEELSVLRVAESMRAQRCAHDSHTQQVLQQCPVADSSHVTDDSPRPRRLDLAPATSTSQVVARVSQHIPSACITTASSMSGETRPLLPKSSPAADSATTHDSTWQELRHLSYMAAQVSLATVARVALTSIDSIYLGHLGVKELAAASLAQVWTSAPLMAVWASASALITVRWRLAMTASTSTERL